MGGIQELGGRSADAAGLSSLRDPAPTGLAHSASIPSAQDDHETGIGIVNPYGALWTTTTFSTVGAAEAYLRKFWGDILSEEKLRKFSLCTVRVTVTPISEPFSLSASGIAAGTGETPQEVRPEGQEPDPKGDAHV